MDLSKNNNIKQDISIKNNDISIIEKQNNFLNSNLGKVINFGVDLGIRAIFPNFIEDQIINIKDIFMKNGFQDGIKKVIDSAIDLGKSTLGIVTGNFENISQARQAVKNGGILDGVSNLVDFTISKIHENTNISSNILKTIKQGKNILIDNISKNIEQNFQSQYDYIEKLNSYEEYWKKAFEEKDFTNMQKQYNKIEEVLRNILPLENTLKEARIIENIHNYIKSNNYNFNLSKEELELAKKLT